MKQATLQQRLRSKKRTQTLLVGVAWYSEEGWAEVKASAIDPACFEDSFSQWKAMANQARREFQRAGVRAIEFQIIPQDFFAWCALNGQENNASSRAQFVTEKLSAAHNIKT